MKKTLVALAMLTVTALLHAQNSKTDSKDTTSNLPKGTYLKEGSLYIQTGYTVLFATDKKTITIVPDNAKGRDNSPGSTSTLKCKCEDETNCGITFTNRKIECFGPECCYLYNAKSVNDLQNNPGGTDIKWQRILNTSPPSFTSPSDKIDITVQFTTKKVRNGTVLVYESGDKYKIYASYKNRQLTEWYAMGEDGKKIKSTRLGITPTTCEDCVMMPTGQMFCKKCVVTPGIVLPVKSAD
jgi:hypothetical protein